MHESNDSAETAGFMDKARTGVTAQLRTQKDRAVDGIGSVAAAVRQSTDHLRKNHHETIAQYVDDAVGQLERFSRRLKERNVGELLGEAQQFARRNPAMFIGSAFALGLLGARFLKSSSGRNRNNAARGSIDPARDFSSASGTRDRDLSSRPSKVQL
jgi:hypothetical protein